MATADPMQPFPGPPAWDRPGTRSAWTAHLLGHLGRARRGFAEELWYAGDPRFAVVVAGPGPRALGYARQPRAFDRRTDRRRSGVSPEARRRALAIRARVAPAQEG